MDNSVQATRKKESTDNDILRKDLEKEANETSDTENLENSTETEADVPNDDASVDTDVKTPSSDEQAKTHTENNNSYTIDIGVVDRKLKKQQDVELKVNGVSPQQNSQQNQKLNNGFNNAVLDNVQVEEIEEKPKDKTKEQQDKDRSPEPQKQESNQGHYETKPGGLILWGLALCCCVLSAPLGGGFAFLLTPAQFASFGLIGFWKRGKRRVWKVDKRSMPEDSLVMQQDFEKLITQAENGNHDNMLTPVPENQTTSLLNDLLKDIPAEQKQKATEELNAFSAAIQALAISEGMSVKDAQEMTSFMASLGGKSNAIQSIANSDIKKAMEDFIAATDDQAKNDAAKQLVDNLQKITHEIAPATEEFPHKELLTQLMNEDPEIVKKMTETLAKRHDAVKNKINSLSGLETSNCKIPSHTSSLNNRNVNEKSIGR